MTQTMNSNGYADINGLHMYYEIHGRGEPLILLHGGLGSTAMFDNIAKMFSEKRRVIAVDLQAHGRTADIDRPLRFEMMSEDVLGLLKHLGIEKADFLGYSLGGGVSLSTVIQHPEVVRKLVLVSTPFSHDGWYPEVQTGMNQMGPESAEQMKSNPIYQLYSQVAPRPQDWTVLVIKTGELVSRDYDWSLDVAGIKSPIMLVFGDADSISPAYAAKFYELLGGGKRDAGWDRSGMTNNQLAILPGTMHYNILSNPMLPSAVESFLDQPVR